jgi:hypothetical protein
MAGDQGAHIAGFDLEKSYILSVIYDDVSVTLDMDFFLLEDHPAYQPPADGEDGCFRHGYIRLADIDDLRLRKADLPNDKQANLSVIQAATIDGDYVFISSAWGEIECTAQSIRFALD